MRRSSSSGRCARHCCSPASTRPKGSRRRWRSPGGRARRSPSRPTPRRWLPWRGPSRSWLARLRAAFADGTARGDADVRARCRRGAPVAEELGRRAAASTRRRCSSVFGVTLERRGFAGTVADVEALEQAGVDFVVGDDVEPVSARRAADGAAGRRCAAWRASEDAEWIVRMHDGGGRARRRRRARWAAELTPPWLMRGERDAARAAGGAARAGGARASGAWARSGCGACRAWRRRRSSTKGGSSSASRRGRACRWCGGAAWWQSRRAWVAAYEWCDVLSVEARVPGLSAHAERAARPRRCCRRSARDRRGARRGRADGARGGGLRGAAQLRLPRRRALASAACRRCAMRSRCCRRGASVDWSVEAEAAGRGRRAAERLAAVCGSSSRRRP